MYSLLNLSNNGIGGNILRNFGCLCIAELFSSSDARKCFVPYGIEPYTDVVHNERSYGVDGG